MAATIHSLISEAKRNKLSLIGPLTEDDVHRVWEKVAQSVETLMSQQKVNSHFPCYVGQIIAHFNCECAHVDSKGLRAL